MVRKTDWLVCDMDDGVLRIAESLKLAVIWYSRYMEDAEVVERTGIAGSYTYVFESGGEESTIFIMQAQYATQNGFSPQAVRYPLYPIEEFPWARVDRDGQ